MKACEIMSDIIGRDFVSSMPWTVDTLKLGDENREVKKIALCHIATPDVISSAADWGADLMITHECTFYNHEDKIGGDKLSLIKKEMIEKAGFALYRYHDSMHFHSEDEVSAAFIKRVGLCGDFDGQLGFVSEKAYSAVSLAKLIEKKLGIRHIRIIGDRNGEGTGILLALGMRGGDCFRSFLTDEENSIAVCGELCEWSDCEPVRDAAQLGMHKAVIVLGHADSESFAMEELTAKIDRKYDGAEAKYFDCGRIYSFAADEE